MEEAKETRMCFVMRLRPERVQDYLSAHAQVRPEMMKALEESVDPGDPDASLETLTQYFHLA